MAPSLPSREKQLQRPSKGTSLLWFAPRPEPNIFLEQRVSWIFKIVIPKPASCVSSDQWWSTTIPWWAGAGLLIYQLTPKADLLKAAHGPFTTIYIPWPLAASDGWASHSANIYMESGEPLTTVTQWWPQICLHQHISSHHLSLYT